MKNKIGDLSDYLFEMIEKITNDDFEFEQFEKEAKIADQVVKLASKIIDCAKVELSMAKMILANGSNIKSKFFEIEPIEPIEPVENTQRKLSNFS